MVETLEPLAAIASRALSPASQARQIGLERARTRSLEAARLLLGSYRTGEANDPEVYISAIVRVLQDYPPEVVQRVVDPLTGLPGRLKWLPSVAEVKAACDEIHGPIKRIAEWDARSAEQLAQREREADERTRRPTIEELKARYGEHFGLDPPRRKTSILTTGQFKAKYGISDAEWDALPNGGFG